MASRVDTKRLIPVDRPQLERMGRKNDGGYIVPGDAIDTAASLLSFGLCYDWEFERAFRRRNRGAVIRCWDHTTTPWGAFREHKLIDYYRFFRDEAVHVRRRVGQGTIDEAFASVARFAPTIVKMDIEGSEYEVWASMMQRQESIDVILAEFHDLDTRPDALSTCIDAWEDHFHVVHIHGNNYARRCDDGFPSVIELTLGKRRFSSEPKRTTRTYPVDGLDTPNNPRRPDYELSL